MKIPWEEFLTVFFLLHLRTVNHNNGQIMKRPLSNSQIACIILLWILLCYIVLTSAERIDGPVIVTILMSGAFVFIPVYKSIKKRR